MFKEHEQIVLTDYVKGHENEELSPGDVGCVVHIHPGAAAYIVEFMSLHGETVGDRHGAPVPSARRNACGHYSR